MSLLNYDEVADIFRPDKVLISSIIPEVIAALSGPIHVDEIVLSDDFETKVMRQAKRIYSNDNRRTFDQVFHATLEGEWGELAIAQRLRARGLPVVENDEEKTLEYHWDLKVHGLTVEIKRQTRWDDQGTLVKRTCFSTNNLEKVRFAREKWSSYDILIAWVPDINEAVLPWLILDSKVFSPELNLFVPTTFEGKTGYFVKTSKAISRGLAIPLNIL